MSTFIDARTSQNATYPNSINIPLLVDTPQLFGQIGLVPQGVTTNPRVILTGTIALQLPATLVDVTITIVRGTLFTSPTVFSATSTYSFEALTPQIISFSGADYNPLITNPLVYTVFISADALGTTRIGPENFDGILVSD